MICMQRCTNSEPPVPSPIKTPCPVTRPSRLCSRSQPRQFEPVPETTTTPQPSSDPATSPKTASLTNLYGALSPRRSITETFASYSEDQSYPEMPKPAPLI